MKAQAAPIASHHLHFFGMNKEMQAWYMQTFGASTLASANPAAFISASLPGLTMNFSPSQTPVAGTQGRAIDHIGFEVKNLEAFTKKLEAQGIKLAVAISPGAGTRDLDRVHHRSVGHLHRADRGAG